MARVVKPWTWEQIAALRGRRREAFLKAYGDRGKVACVVSKKVLSDQGQTDEMSRLLSCRGWSCLQCPVFPEGAGRAWCDKGRQAQLGCVDYSPEVYAAMVKELGLLPEVRQRWR